jgi:hypothetical protein
MKRTPGWLAVDEDGLRDIRENTPKSAIAFELISNAFDTNASFCDIEIKPIAGRKDYFTIIVKDDDPEGFIDLTHAYTLFAKSIRKGDTSKRGRFNIGEKFALVMCESAIISSTKGTIEFNEDGTRLESNSKLSAGSIFKGVINMTLDEAYEIENEIRHIIIPEGIKLIMNGFEIIPQKSLKVTEGTLPTIIMKPDGRLNNTQQKTKVEIYRVPENQTARIFELGIPIVETGDKFHYNILKKVPVTMDRRNIVTASYLEKVRLIVAEAMVNYIDEEDANSTWVREAVSNKDASKELVATSLKARFGDKTVAFDPSDLEANNRAVANGYTVIKGRQLSGKEWNNVKSHELLPSASSLFPTHPEGAGSEMKSIPEEKWTPGMRDIYERTIELASELIGTDIIVRFINEIKYPKSANYGGRTLTYNIGDLGYKWFDNGMTEKVLSLIIHELAHEYESNHLSDKFYFACCDLGARAAMVAVRKPRLFENKVEVLSHGKTK